MKRPSIYMTMTDGVTQHDYTRELNKYIDYLEKQINLTIPIVVGQSEQLPFDFIVWYSGMEKQKILNAYSLWLKEKGN